MKIVSIVNTKGGVGKTTFSIFAATYAYHVLFKKGVKIGLIEFDSQQSVSDIRREEIGLDSKKKKAIQGLKEKFPGDFEDRIKKLYRVSYYSYEKYLEDYNNGNLENEYDLLFLDFPGADLSENSTLIQRVLLTIDTMAIPVQPESKAIKSLAKFLQKLSKTDIEQAWFINMMGNTNFCKDVKDKVHPLFLKASPNLTKLMHDNGEHVIINRRPAFYDKYQSTILPFDDSEGNIKSIVKYLIK